jgi:hypothetical protein
MRSLCLVVLAACAAEPGGSSPSVHTATVTRTGGLAPSIPGSSCQPMDETFTYDAPTHRLTWRLCESPSTGAPFAFHTGARTLDAATAVQLETALHGLYASEQACGGDITDTVIVDGTTYVNAQCYAGDADLFAILEPLAS